MSKSKKYVYYRCKGKVCRYPLSRKAKKQTETAPEVRPGSPNGALLDGS